MPEPVNHKIRLIVGLGNPGKEYERTRHNVGFMVLDMLAAKWKTSFSTQGKWRAEQAQARNHDLYLLKPLTFMNLSGEAVSACRHFYKIKPEEILVIYDEVALPLGKLRLRAEGSAGGHNGMKSLIQHLGGQNFPRMRLGIGGADKSSLGGHVLGKFSDSEQETLNKMLDRAAEAIQFATLRGWDQAMNKFNAEPKEPKAKQPKPPKPAALPNLSSEPSTPESAPHAAIPDAPAPDPLRSNPNTSSPNHDS